eukprot:241446-Amphidinium_carterae.1
MHMICCAGCGIPLQTHDPQLVGFTKLSYYLEMWSRKMHRTIRCSRCVAILGGALRPVVQETMGPRSEADAAPYRFDGDRSEEGFGASVVPAEVLRKQLQTIRERRCLVVYVVDVLDNGSFIRRFRRMIGQNAVIVVATKIDLLPPGTDLEEVKSWMQQALQAQGLAAIDIVLVSSVTGKNIRLATKTICEARRSKDVFVVGAANAGKSMFITRLLEQLAERYPDGEVEKCQVPVISQTPGTTLGMIPLRAFRRSRESSVFAHLFDTPGVHQPW